MRERPRGRVEIDLDGAPWRLVPADAVIRADLLVGRSLDREAARRLGRELRRAEALGLATRALRHRSLSRGRLEARLAGRGASPAARADAIDVLERAGLVDDARLAAARADVLGGRGYGDAAIRLALAREGFGDDAATPAIEALEPEADRARRLAERWGRGPKALRRLAARGFDEATLDEIAPFAEDA